MKIVTLDVQPLSEGLAAFARSLKVRKAETSAHISFETPELLWKVLGAKRWDLFKAMVGQGPLTIRGAAHRVGRDVKAVHADVRALLDTGIIEQSDGRIVFPYDAIHVDFVLKAA
jgi:predicted transcriptional regulator